MPARLDPVSTLLSRVLLQLATALAAGLLVTGAQAQTSVKFCYDPYPPYTFGQTGAAPTGGSALRLLEEIFAGIKGVEASVILLPWKRCQQMARLGQVDGILPLIKDAEREQYLAFSDSVWEQRSVFWYKRAKHPQGIAWRSFEDIAGLPLGMLLGSFISAEMEAAFSARGTLERVGAPDNLFRMLLAERLDLVALDEGVGNYVIHKNGWDQQLVAATQIINMQEAYLGISKASPALSLLPRLNERIRVLKAQRRFKQIPIETSRAGWIDPTPEKPTP